METYKEIAAEHFLPLFLSCLVLMRIWVCRQALEARDYKYQAVSGLKHNRILMMCPGHSRNAQQLCIKRELEMQSTPVTCAHQSPRERKQCKKREGREGGQAR